LAGPPAAPARRARGSCLLKRIGILDLPSPGVFGGVCAELIVALSTAMQDLGVEVLYSRNRLDTNMPVLVFNWYRMFIAGKIPASLPANAFLFNLSPFTETKELWYANYLQYLGRAPALIDYSDFNLAQLEGGNARRFRWTFGYLPLGSLKFPARGNELLFYGRLNEYRSQRLQQLKQDGAKLRVLENVWGHERDLQIATSRAVLNIGKFPHNVLEVYRLWQALCLGTPVISERGVDAVLASEWAPYVTLLDEIRQARDLEVEPVPVRVFQTGTSFHDNARKLLAFIQDS